MGVGVEVFFADDLQDVADDGVVAQHAAQSAALGVTAVRRQTVRGPLVRHPTLPAPHSGCYFFSACFSGTTITLTLVSMS